MGSYKAARSSMARLWLAGALSVVASGCASGRADPAVQHPPLPELWERASRDAAGPVQDGWVETIGGGELADLINRALADNHQLAQQRLVTRQARAAITVAGADRWPELSLDLTGTRRNTIVAGNSEVGDNYTLLAGLSFEVDLWGELDAAQRQAVLSWLSAEAELSRAERQLVADVARRLYESIEARELLNLFRERLSNLSQNLDIIESGYRSGLYEALDVYLSRNGVEQEQANVAQQQQALYEAVTGLELLLAEYPDGMMAVESDLPVLTAPIDVGLPSELITRRPDLQQAWLDLLARDAALAVAHKRRFPSLVLTASAGHTDGSLGQLLTVGEPAWVAAASLAQPVFQAGRLRALEQQARLQVEQAERAYLQTVYRALAEVENALSNQVSLTGRYRAFLNAQRNAKAALTVSFDQYQRGLIDYTTVLESQRRAFDAETTVVRLKNQLLQNRISLHLALGGGFEGP